MKKKLFYSLIALFVMIPLFNVNSPAQAAGFTDVPARALEEVTYLSDGNIAKGSSATIFNSDRTITRAEAAIFIGRALQLNGTPRKTVFRDVDRSSTAAGYIQSGVDAEIILGYLSGVSQGNFYPNKAITRGEMAIMIANAFEYSYGGTASGAAKALMTRGVADGMGNGSFGASYLIKRADFAVFLGRAINPEFRTKDSASFSKSLWSNGPNLNIRKGPSTAYASIGKLSENQQVTAAHSVGGWTYIKAGTTTGFVATSYTRPTAVKPAAPTESADSRIASQTIIIDPGHGGTDPGAVGFGLHEADVVLKTGLKVNNLLKQTPFNVKMTRSTDTFVSLTGRSNFAKNQGGDVFVSIHANAATASASGTETFYYSAATNPYVADSKLLAAKIQNRMIAAWNLKNRGVKSGNYSVLRENNMPAALAELGFITNKSDNAKLASDYWLNSISKAIYYGILDYHKAKGYEVDSLYNVAK
ncbi:N-acetylmuramoyl-L-alanine amidase [Domibacillus iocasae]|uniref:Cell wall hydrolase n=1 Tax=Domibacillus iocasae TaxID=1714016 RepID=A0A1E7DQF9_9BACI|nr:N-acetylmuramoyl-L-alanine amidase [Domibacillus iocasae]OES44918.1 cell wall hydrolase [Domibacillus iocasae]